jgi:chromosomal replication initiator protein
MLAETRISTPEQEFIKQLNSYLEYPLGKHGENKVKEMLLAYRARNPLLRIVKQSDPKVVADILARQKTTKKLVQPEDIIRIVGEYVEMDSEKFVNVKCRSVDLVYARYLCMFFCRRYSRLSLNQVGKVIGGKDHTIVIHGCASLKRLIETDERVKADVENINSKIIAFRATLTNVE